MLPTPSSAPPPGARAHAAGTASPNCRWRSAVRLNVTRGRRSPRRLRRPSMGLAIERADRAMYAAKTAGRNAVVRGGTRRPAPAAWPGSGCCCSPCRPCPPMAADAPAAARADRRVARRRAGRRRNRLGCEDSTGRGATASRGASRAQRPDASLRLTQTRPVRLEALPGLWRLVAAPATVWMSAGQEITVQPRWPGARQPVSVALELASARFDLSVAPGSGEPPQRNQEQLTTTVSALLGSLDHARHERRPRPGDERRRHAQRIGGRGACPAICAWPGARNLGGVGGGNGARAPARPQRPHPQRPFHAPGLFGRRAPAAEEVGEHGAGDRRKRPVSAPSPGGAAVGRERPGRVQPHRRTGDALRIDGDRAPWRHGTPWRPGAWRPGRAAAPRERTRSARDCSTVR